MTHADRLNRAAALDEDYAFLEEPQASLPLDTRAAPGPGPLQGMLIGVKSNTAVAGQAWTAGMQGRSDRIATADAALVRSLRRAGAGVLSRLTMDEAALGAATEASGFCATRNPSAPGRSVGGSSGGSAAAVACGAVPAALGSDTLGSVRIPAAYCGVLGLKPGRGVLPMNGIFPLAPGFDTPGLIARGPEDLSRVLGALSKPGAAAPAPVFELTGEKAVVCDPEVTAAFETAKRVLTNAGLWSGARAFPGWSPADLRKAAFAIVCARASQTLASEPTRSAAVARALAYGARQSEANLAQAESLCAQISDALHEMLADGAVAMTATTPTVAFPTGTPAPASQADFTVLANIADLPAISVPVGGGGLPCAVQLIASRGQEGTLIALAGSIMAAAPMARIPASRS